jgi:hypothetical protein
MGRLSTLPYSLGVNFILAAVLLCASNISADINCAADDAGCCCTGTRGNVDCDFSDAVDVADLTILIDHLFISLDPLPSVDEANIDGEEQIDIADLTRLIDFLYISLAPLPGCPGPVNHPPQTTLLGLYQSPPLFNTTSAEFGLPVYWYGSDRIDHPYLRPPLTYEWRVYGPYDSTQFNDVLTRFEKQVFVTPTGEVYVKGTGAKIIWCDTTWIIGPPNQLVVTCHDLLIDTVTTSNQFGTLETIVDVSSPDFVADSELNRIAMSIDAMSTDTSAALFDLFRLAPHDTTQASLFFFWIRARDADDTTLFDPAPSFLHFEVYDPMFERGLLIADAGVGYSINGRLKESAEAYWQRAVKHWDSTMSFDTLTVSQSAGNSLPFLDLLRHKVVIMLNDDVFTGVTTSSPIRTNLQKAMGAGLNVWLCGRNQLSGQEGSLPVLDIHFPATLGGMFGLLSTQYSGWQFYADDSAMRIEDFAGATALDSSAWPNLWIDTTLLHSRYDWSSYPYESLLGALPEVNHLDPASGAEILYTYRSLYSGAHPLIPDSAFQQGKPVVTRYDRGVNRVVVSAFTPYAFDDASSPSSPMQVFVDSVLNWLSAGGSSR